MVLGITENSFDFSIVTRLVTFAEDLHHPRPVTNSNGSFASANLGKMGQMSKICSQAHLFGQPLTSWRACNTGITCVLGFVINRLIVINMASPKVLHEVTGCIFKQGDEEPAMKWLFLTKIEAEDLAAILRNLKLSGINQRAKEIGVLKYKLKCHYKQLTQDPEFARGRISSIDTDEQF